MASPHGEAGRHPADRGSASCTSTPSTRSIPLRSLTPRLAPPARSTPRLCALDSRVGDDRTTYRIAVHREGDDPRIARHERVDLDAAEWADVDRRLESLDARSTIGPWTRATLRIIADRPGVLAATLASELGQERAPFKQRVRHLKALGLTESLEVGYRLSPLGAAALTHLPDG